MVYEIDPNGPAHQDYRGSGHAVAAVSNNDVILAIRYIDPCHSDKEMSEKAHQISYLGKVYKGLCTTDRFITFAEVS